MFFRATMGPVVLALIFSVLGTAHGAQKKKAQAPVPVSVLYNVDSEKISTSNNHDQIVSIASMTKMLTVLAVLESKQDLNETIKVIGREGSARIRSGLLMTRLDLIELTLVSSDNLAARTLIEHYPGGYNEGITAINAIAQRIGAVNTSIVEPTGLSADNKSTAIDLVRVAKETSRYELFKRFANRERSEIQVEQTSKTKRFFYWIRGNNTNPFIHETGKIEILSAKTGFTNAAGWCLTMMFSYNGNRYVLVTAGNRNKLDRKRIADSLVEWVTNYEYGVKITDAGYSTEF